MENRASPLMDRTLYVVEVVPCAVCSQPCEKTRRVCLACAKFHERNKAKPMSQLKCQTGTNQCLLTDNSAVRISTGATWRLICRRCRLAKCLQVFANIDNDNKESSENSDKDNVGNLRNSNNHTIGNNANNNNRTQTDEHCKELENAVTEMMTMFEIVCMQWAANSNVVDLANMMSSTIVLFSRQIRGFTDLPETLKLQLTFQAGPMISLVLVLITKRNIASMHFLTNLFPMLKTLKEPKFKMLQQEIDGWKPTNAEMGCLLTVIICRTLFEHGNTIGTDCELIKNIDSAISQTVPDDRKCLFFRFLTTILSIAN